MDTSPVKLRGLIVVFSSLACSCISPPAAPTYPESPLIQLPYLETFSGFPPSAPTAPQEWSPEIPDVDWQDVWVDQFSSVGTETGALLDGEALGIVIPAGVSDELRYGLLSAVLNENPSTFDLGVIQEPQLTFNSARADGSQDEQVLVLGLTDPTASWAAAAVAGELQLDRVFRVQALSVVPTTVDVVKFDIAPFMVELEDVNESIAGYNAKVDEYDRSYEDYEDAYAEYLVDYQAWFDSASAAIDFAKVAYEAEVGAIFEEFERKRRNYNSSSRGRNRSVESEPQAEPPSFQAPDLAAPAPKQAQSPLGKMEAISVNEVRALLTQMVTESVPSQTVHILGQSVSRGTGRTVATIDCSLTVPVNRGLTDAQLVQELMARALKP